MLRFSYVNFEFIAEFVDLWFIFFLSFVVDRNLYTIRAVPFTEVRSVRRHTPPLGWQYIIVVLSSGIIKIIVALQWLYFG